MDEPVDEAADVAAYLGRLETERGYSAHTITGYRRDLATLTDLHEQAGGARGDWRAISDAQVRRWVAHLSRQGLGPKSLARLLSAWRGFFDALAEDGKVDLNPVRAVRAPKLPRRLPKALSVDQAMQLVDAGDLDHFEALRDQAIIELFYSSGLRLSELTSLDARYVQEPRGGYRSASWFDPAAEEVTVHGKGSKKRSGPGGRPAPSSLVTRPSTVSVVVAPTVQPRAVRMDSAMSRE